MSGRLCTCPTCGNKYSSHDNPAVVRKIEAAERRKRAAASKGGRASKRKLTKKEARRIAALRWEGLGEKPRARSGAGSATSRRELPPPTNQKGQDGN